MIFLIEYKRSAGRLVMLTTFDDSDRARAESERLALEMQFLTQPNDHEIVLLEAESESALRRTHRRYFENIASLAESAGGT